LFFPDFFSCRRHCSVGIPLYQFAAIIVTVGGVKCAFSLALDQDGVPVTLRVVEMKQVAADCSHHPVQVQVTLSDGIHCSTMILARWLHHLGGELHQGDIVTLTNYISQCVKDSKVVIIYLDITVAATSEAIIGNPSDLMSVSKTINQPIAFLVTSVHGFCSECQQTPWDWSLLGPTIVECI
jgi:hypothetical protein